jgi:hypothetical protein
MMAGGENGRPRDPLPAARGAAWFMLSLELLRRQASRLLFIAILMQLVLGLVQVPVLGILVVLSVPGLPAGVRQPCACCSCRWRRAIGAAGFSRWARWFSRSAYCVCRCCSAVRWRASTRRPCCACNRAT